MNLLAELYSGGNKLKRLLSDFASDPVGNIQQGIGNANDKARSLNQLTALATQEHVNRIKGIPSGQVAENKLAQLLADSYNPAGITVWHGSPHKFNAFDSSKIGTGEGAQAYGHGLYLAESEDVAKGYRSKLNDPVIDRVKADLYEIAGDQKWIVKAFDKNGKVIPKVSGYLDPQDISKHYGEDVSKLVLGTKYGGDFKNLGIQDGALYKVDLPDDQVAKMLDWDKPLSQQAQEVQKAISDYSSLSGIGLDGAMSGKQVYDSFGASIAKQKGYTPNEYGKVSGRAADELRWAGIPGIRYLDGGSRGAGTGTSNFVVFPGNEGLLKILERNGKPLE